MKNDPLQGILFKSKPLLLQQRADERAAQSSVATTQKPEGFLEKIQHLKSMPKYPKNWRGPLESLRHHSIVYEVTPHSQKTKELE